MSQLNLAFKNILKAKTICGLLSISCFVIFMWFIIPMKGRSISNVSELTDEKSHSNHTLCVLVPYRDVFEELMEFVPHISKFLNRQSIDFHIVVLDHVPDGNRFNRGAVFNAGFKIISKVYPDCDYIALHDIDLLPLNDELSYSYPGNEVYHVANPDYHPLGLLYNRDIYIGGIAIISNELFTRVNGFGNKFWGWGIEDQNFSLRLKTNYIKVNRPTNLTTDRSNTFKHIHGINRKRDTIKCRNQLTEGYLKPDIITGIKDVKYEISSVHSFVMDEFPFSLFGISLPCNFTETPWCKSFCLPDTNAQNSEK